MFGISIWEFLMILVVAVLVIPARHWGDVAKFLARCVKFIRNLIWKISDATENIKEQIDREMPIDRVIRQTTDDMLGTFSKPLKKSNSPRRREIARATPFGRGIKK